MRPTRTPPFEIDAAELEDSDTAGVLPFLLASNQVRYVAGTLCPSTLDVGPSYTDMLDALAPQSKTRCNLKSSEMRPICQASGVFICTYLY